MQPQNNRQVATQSQMLMSESTWEKLSHQPLWALPPELRDAVLMVWSVHKHLFNAPHAISFAIGAWCAEIGLDPADARTILKQMMHPESMMHYKFASDFMTDLAGRVADIVKRREAERARKEEREKLNALPPKDQNLIDMLDKMKQSFGVDPNANKRTSRPVG